MPTRRMTPHDSLATYRAKRDFHRTPEPSGAGMAAAGRSYVIQKHAARRLHYDLRLELDGALKSWAVPRGPSLDPGERRLAVHVEDHPLDYASFEGVIPHGQYGGGEVVIWDRGWWEPLGDPDQGYRRGRLRFRLHGDRLRGEWTLARMHGAAGDGDKNWLLIKHNDDDARHGATADIVARLEDSVVTGRTIRDLARLHPAAGRRGDRAAPSDAAREQRRRVAAVRGAVRAAMPVRLGPQLAMAADAPTRGEDWLHEIKYDGYRVMAWRRGSDIRLYSRNDHDWTERFSPIAEALAALPWEDAILDGEVVALDREGRSDFQALQNALRDRRSGSLVYYLFDMPYCAGYDLCNAPLVERKAALDDGLRLLDTGGRLRYSDHVTGDGQLAYEQACRLGIEGIICKRAASHYRSARTRDWLKVKCIARQEFVIVGYTESRTGTAPFGSLALGYYDDAKTLQYAGHVGTGFSDAVLRDLGERFRALRRRDSPFPAPLPAAEARGVHWLEPRLVAAVAFSHWTRDDRLRQPSYIGLREDKPATAVQRERTVSTAAPRRGKEGAPHPAAARPPSRRIAGVDISHPDKVLYPEQGLTKRALADYYAAVSRYMLPQVANRPLSVMRCPQGRAGECFFQKHFREASPAGVYAIEIEEAQGTAPYAVIRGLEGLIGLVQRGVLEIHVWGSRADRVQRPDRLVFDLDPAPDVAWPRVIRAALRLRLRLADLGLESFLKTTGGKGLHVHVPLQRRREWPDAKAFTRGVAEALVRESPQEFIATMSKSRRAGKIFIDYLRNGAGATSIAPYSTRARPGAPVAMPLEWEALSDLPSGDYYTTANAVPALEARARDPWADLASLRQSITADMMASVTGGSRA